MNRFAILVTMASLGLSACAGGPHTPAQSVYAVENGYAAALSAAVAYRRLPVCGSGEAMCHDPAVVAKMIVANKAARTAMDSAETIARSEGPASARALAASQAAVDALTAFQNLVQKVETK